MSQGQPRDARSVEMPSLCRTCEARDRGICGALSAAHLEELSRYTTRRVVSMGSEIFAEEQEQDVVANLLSGVVKLSKLMSDGRQQIVALQFAPDFVGRPFERTTQVSAEAATTVRVCSFPRSVLERLAERAPEMEHRLHSQALRELDEARDWLMTLGRRTAAERVATFLLLIAEHIDLDAEEPAAEFDLPLKRADIADFLGLTIETVSRQITRLRRAEVIAVRQNRHVTVLDLDALREAAGSD
ncbi:MAG: Crp/Fnr family transcriptional regulator [Pseudomonadota bacterium]